MTLLLLFQGEVPVPTVTVNATAYYPELTFTAEYENLTVTAAFEDITMTAEFPV